jgi:enterobactin synthetase component F
LWAPYINGELIQYDVKAPHECLLQRQYLEQFGKLFVEALLKRQARPASTALTKIEV